jgi:hypothetical protein
MHSPHSYPDNYSDPWFLYGKGKEFRQMGILPHSYPDNYSDPWFLYGKGKEFRQMGILPPIPQTSSED